MKTTKKSRYSYFLRLLRNFDQACQKYAFSGSYDIEDQKIIKECYIDAKEKLKEYYSNTLKDVDSD